MMLTASREHYRRQQRIAAMGLDEARRSANRGPTAVAAVVARYQYAAAELTYELTPSELSEQGIEAPVVGGVRAAALLTRGSATTGLLSKIANEQAFDRLMVSLIQDAGRTASVVDIGRRPAITGYVRALRPPSCSRCTILASRVYRYSTGFQRHPLCDCVMTPTTQAVGRDLVTDPTDLVDRGLITGLSKGDAEALSAGADLGRVVNVRRSQAGLRVGSSVMDRAGRPSPQAIMRLTPRRAAATDLLRRHGYIL